MTEKVVPELMNTREVARYLGINDKKVYFLAKAGKIPCTRVTGKWTFPKKLIDRWIEESASGLVERKAKTEERDFLLAAGSDDPSLGILHDLYEAQTQTASFFMTTIGSSAGLAAIRSGVADFATAHLLEPARTGADNLAPQELLPSDTVVVELFYRELGMLVAAGNPKSIKSLRDLARPKLRIINRQPGSGTRIYSRSGAFALPVEWQKISGYDSIVSTHLEVGLRVLRWRCRRRLSHSDNGAVAGARFHSSHPRALRPMWFQRIDSLREGSRRCSGSSARESFVRVSIPLAGTT